MNHDCDCEVTTDPVIAQHIKQNENANKMIMIHKQTWIKVVRSPQDSLWK